MAKIVILEAFHSNPGDQSWEEIEALGEVTIYERTKQDQMLTRAIDADILITNKLKMTDEIIGQLPKLKLIHQLATGTDNIDKVAAEKYGVIVRNAVGYSTNGVAQHVFALILELANHVSIHHQDTLSGGWSESDDWCHMVQSPFELNGKNLGIIGFGQIGQAVANIGQAFGMRILVYSNHATKEAYPHIELKSLDELARESDIVTIHSPLTEASKGIINGDLLKKMKSSALLINTARGGHIIENDLAEALKNNTIAAAGLDVLDSEPPIAGNPLIGLPNCIITPHIAWTAYESRKRLITIVAKNIKDYLVKQ